MSGLAGCSSQACFVSSWMLVVCCVSTKLSAHGRQEARVWADMWACDRISCRMLSSSLQTKLLTQHTVPYFVCEAALLQHVLLWRLHLVQTHVTSPSGSNASHAVLLIEHQPLSATCMGVTYAMLVALFLTPAWCMGCAHVISTYGGVGTFCGCNKPASFSRWLWRFCACCIVCV